MALAICFSRLGWLSDAILRSSERKIMSATRSSTGGSSLTLSRNQRACLSVLTLVSVGLAFGILFAYRGSSNLPDLLLGVLGIGSLVLGALAVIGRLPAGFEVAGMPVEFKRAGLADVIGTVKSVLNDDPDNRNAILEALRDTVGDESFREAEGQVAGASRAQGEEDEDEGVAIDDRLDEMASPSVKVDRVRHFAEQLTDAPQSLREGYEVPNSGRGKAPKFDLFVKRGGHGIALEREHYWNRSTVGLVVRKTERSLKKGTPVDRVIIIAPRAGVQDFQKALEANEDVLVLSDDSLEWDAPMKDKIGKFLRV